MLSVCIQDPFKHFLASLKKIYEQNPANQHKKLKRITNDLHSICIFNNFFIRILDFHHYRQLCQIYEIFIFDIDPKQAQIITPSHINEQKINFQKNDQKIKEDEFQKLSKNDLTPSTKKSRALAIPNIAILVQDLIQSIEKFEQVQQNLEDLTSLISHCHKGQQILKENQDYQFYDGDFQKLYYLVDTKLKENSIICPKKNVEILQIHKLINQIVEFMNNVENSSNQIQEVMKSQSPYSQQTQQILQGVSVNQKYSKQSNGANSKRSLLTEMLRDSSIKSNIQIQNQIPARELRLRPNNKDYSQKQNIPIIDKAYRISVIKTQKPRISSQKYLKSEMDQVIYGVQSGKRKAQKHAKKNGIGCSNCQIF